jgi:hypothetical protein
MAKNELLRDLLGEEVYWQKEIRFLETAFRGG